MEVDGGRRRKMEDTGEYRKQTNVEDEVSWWVYPGIYGAIVPIVFLLLSIRSRRV